MNKNNIGFIASFPIFAIIMFLLWWGLPKFLPTPPVQEFRITDHSWKISANQIVFVTYKNGSVGKLSTSCFYRNWGDYRVSLTDFEMEIDEAFYKCVKYAAADVNEISDDFPERVIVQFRDRKISNGIEVTNLKVEENKQRFF